MAWSGYSEKGQGAAERGPGTFTFAPPGTPQQQAPGYAGDLRAPRPQAQDNFGQRTQRAGPDTLGMVLKFADQATKPMIEKMRGEQLLKGAQQAAQGEAIVDIINEQPWYSKIFGESATVEGARAYTVQAGVDNWAAQFDEQMPELRQLNPDQLRAHLLKTSDKLKTGDRDTDALIGMNALKVMPSLMKRQAREHYKFNQERMVTSQFNAWTSAGASLQAARTAEPGMYSEEDLTAREDLMFNSIEPVAGQEPDAYAQNLARFIGTVAEAGQFHTLNSLVNSGIVASLRPEDRLAVERGIRTFQKQHAAVAAEGYAKPILEMRYGAANGLISAAQVFAQADGINADYTNKSGNPELIISKGERVSTGLTALQAIAALDKDQAKLAAKAAEGTERQAQVLTALRTSSTKALKDTGQLKGQEIDDAFKAQFDAAGSPEAQAQMLARDAADGGKVDYIQSDIRRLLSNNGDTADNDFLKAYGWFRELNKIGGPGRMAVASYFGEKDASRMAVFHEALAGRDVAEFGEYAYAKTLQVRMDPGYRFNKDETKEVNEYIDKQVRGNNWHTFGVAELTGSAKLAVSNVMAATYGTLKASTDPQVALDDSFQRAKAKGLEVFGSHAWVVDPFRPRLETLIGPKGDRDGLVVTPKEISDGLNDLVKARVKAITDKTPDDVLLVRLPEQSGVVQFMAYVTVGGQVIPPTVFNGDDLYGSIKKKMTEPAAAKLRMQEAGVNPWGGVVGNAPSIWERGGRGVTPSTSGMGPALTFTPKPGAPSIYAPAPVREAYRKQQGK